MSTAVLRQMVSGLIEQHINPQQLLATKRAEALERDTLRTIVEQFGEGKV